MTSQHTCLRALLIASSFALCLAAVEARATSVHFIPSDYAMGFDVDELGFPAEIDYEIPTEEPWLSAGSEGDWDITYTLEQCLLVNGTGPCQDGLAAGVGPYTAIVTLALATDVPETGVLLFLSGLSASPAYGSDVSIVIPEAGSGLTELQTIRWISAGGNEYYYLGFLLDNVNQPSVTLSYEVATAQLAEGTPIIQTNAVFGFVPEPSTAVLFGLGLGWLAVRGRR